jgi:exopolysaccharide biosynthesis operon protein EpsL
MVLRQNVCGRGRRFSHLLSIMAGAAFCSPASALNGDVITPYADYALSYEDNLLRLHDSATAKATLGTDNMSDTVRRATAGLRFDKELGRQHLSANIGVNRTNYDRYRQLENTGKDLFANWNWQLGNNFSGNLGVSYLEGLTPYEDFRALEPNIRRQQRNNVDAAWRLHPNWRVVGAYSRYVLTYDLDAQRANNRTLDTTEFGVDYLARTNSTIGLQARHTRGGYPNSETLGSLFADNSYDQNEFKAKVDWRVTGKSRIQFVGGWVQRKHDAFPTRDFNGVNARLIGDSAVTGKVGVALNAWREIGAVDDLAANYALTHGLSLTSNWNVSPKVHVDGAIRIEERDYNGVTALAGLAPSDRSDRYRKLTLGVTYQPSRHVQVAASVFHDILNSNITQLGYRANGVQVNARYEF